MSKYDYQDNEYKKTCGFIEDLIEDLLLYHKESKYTSLRDREDSFSWSDSNYTNTRPNLYIDDDICAVRYKDFPFGQIVYVLHCTPSYIENIGFREGKLLKRSFIRKSIETAGDFLEENTDLLGGFVYVFRSYMIHQGMICLYRTHRPDPYLEKNKNLIASAIRKKICEAKERMEAKEAARRRKEEDERQRKEAAERRKERAAEKQRKRVEEALRREREEKERAARRHKEEEERRRRKEERQRRAKEEAKKRVEEEFRKWQEEQERRQRAEQSRRSSGSYDFFKGCNTWEKVTVRYKNLMKTYHPDSGMGDEDTAKVINAQYDEQKEKFGK